MKEAEEEDEDKNINNLIKNVLGKSRINLIQLFSGEEKYRWFLIYDDIEYLFPKTKDEINDKNKIQELVNKCYNESFSINWKLKELFTNEKSEINNMTDIKEKEKEKNNLIKEENTLLNIDIIDNNNNNINVKK